MKTKPHIKLEFTLTRRQDRWRKASSSLPGCHTVRTRPVCLRAVLCLVLLACVAESVRAAVTQAWVQRFNNPEARSTDAAVKVVRDAAGDIIVTGNTDNGIHGSDMLTIKYSGATGSVLWQRRYNGLTNGHDVALALAVDGSGNVIVTGTADARLNDFGAFVGGGYYTAKYAAADGALLWEKRFNQPGIDYRYDKYRAVAVDISGNVVMTGGTYNGAGGSDDNDFYTAKYAAADGALLWEKRYNGVGRADWAKAVVVDSNGDVVVMGHSNGGNNDYPGNYDYYTAKYSGTNGFVLWQKRYNAPANSYDIAHAMAVDGSGNVVVTGASDSNGTSDYYTAKYAATNGALLWEKRYNGPVNSFDEARAVAVDANGDVAVTGSSYNSNGNWDYYTAKYAATNGTLLWEKHYNGPAEYASDQAQAVAVDSNGNVVVTGYSENGEPDYDRDYHTVAYAAQDGALLWEKRYDGPASGYASYDVPNAVAVDGNRDVVVTGGSENSFYTAKYAAANGALLWEKSNNGGPANGDDYAAALAMDSNGNVVMTGYPATIKYLADGTGAWTNNGGSALAVDGSDDVVVTGTYYGTNIYASTVKYAAASGALLWATQYDPAHSDVVPWAVAVDGSGNVAVTGYSRNGAPNYDLDYYTAKYAAANGALLWQKRYNGPGNSDDFAFAVALDGSGNLVVTGYSGNYPNADLYTAKYAAANGALLWEKRFNAPSSNDGASDGAAVAVDGSGNVVVTGSSQGGNKTAKYASADGALLWEERHSPAHAVAVDGSGNVVVAGYAYNGAPNYDLDYYTAKYAAGDGGLLWEKRYNGPANKGDEAYAVAVDSSGNVIVTGYSFGSGSSADYYTVKYAAANGALLWEKRYNGPANGDDRLPEFSPMTSRILALGPNGSVAITGCSDANLSSSTTYDYATIVYWENLPSVSIAMMTTGVRLRFTGIPGRSYQVQRAASLTGPWESINTQPAPASGLIEFNDTNPPLDAAFYRTVQP